jgi:phage tail-like protein
MTPSEPSRTVAAAHFALTVDGVDVGAVRSVSGGGIYADVIEERPGGHLAEKHVGPPKYEPISVELGLGANKAIRSWLDELLAGKASRRSGTIETADANWKVKSVLEFADALVTEIAFPALDGSSKDAAYLTLTFQPERITRTKGSGKSTQPQVGAKQKKWLASNFRLTLGDLPTKRVAKIDAFAITQRVAAEDEGEIRRVRKQAGIVEIPDLRVTFSEADLPGWEEWFDDFVVDGNSGQAQELSGTIEFLDAALKKPLGSIELANVGIYKLAPESGLQAGKETVRRWTAALYVESMKFTLG